MTRGAEPPTFRPHVRLGVPGPLHVEAPATRLLWSRAAVPFLVTGLGGWPVEPTTGLPVHPPGARVVRPGGTVFPTDFSLRELRQLDVDDDEAVADFQARWGWSGGTPSGALLFDVLGTEANKHQPEWLSAAERRAAAVPGQEQWSRFVTVNTLRERVLLARALVDVVQAFVNGQPRNRAASARDAARVEQECHSAWAASVAGLSGPRGFDPADEQWTQWWTRALQAGLDAIPAGVVTSHGELTRTARPSWYAVVCVELARMLEVGSPWQRCANQPGCPIPGGWFTEKRETRPGRRSGHGTPHKVGGRFCSPTCEKAKTERDRRRRRRAEAAAAQAAESQAEQA